MQWISEFNISKVENISTKRQYVKNGFTTIGCFNKRPNMNKLNSKYSFNQWSWLSRFESSLIADATTKKVDYRPNYLALEHINSGNPTTSETINSVLLNQKVSITEKELETLLALPTVKFDLPITDQTNPALLGLIGKPGSKRSKAGVYIFSYKHSDKKYVGSSNDLARRFKQYFEKNTLFNNKDTGILLPMMEKEQLKAFTLEVTVIPSSYPKYSHCFLEQYHLLKEEFNLNTHKTVNFRVNQGFNIYMYDKECKILYYTSNSLNAFCADLGIHHSSYKKHIANNSPFLDYFILSSNLIPETTISELTELEVRELVDERRKLSLNKHHLSYGKVVEVIDSETNTTKVYDSNFKAAARFGFSRTSLRNYLASGKLYKNRYIFKYINSQND